MFDNVRISRKKKESSLSLGVLSMNKNNIKYLYIYNKTLARIKKTTIIRKLLKVC